ncbi:TrmH family RNA methyltransferase [Bacillus kwashiorkori]|uniref:TrmH family RNA methyltransferase n=1 Tax=Bacillus kwashiorkori TaxID=1522318 RepID=UPI000781A52E|nr:RNA methyltransferase [Bacillus kwashiorkori]
MKLIQSPKNEKVKQWRKLLTKKGRDTTKSFLVEGEHLVEEALRANLIQELIVTENYYGKLAKAKYASLEMFVISNEVAKVISDTETPQGIFSVCKQLNETNIEGSKFLLIDAVQDPGNLGTMIRTADAAGIDAVIVGTGSVDIYNSKVIRSAQGSHFHLPVVRSELTRWINQLQQLNIPVYGTSLENGISMYEITPSHSFALIVGNEGQGMSQELLKLTEKNLYIPIYGKSESLNVAIATGILLYYLRG